MCIFPLCKFVVRFDLRGKPLFHVFRFTYRWEFFPLICVFYFWRRLGCVFELFLALFSLLEHLNTRVTPFRQRKWSESPPLSDTRANLIIGQTSAIRTPIECMKTFCEYLPCYPKLFIWRVKRWRVSNTRNLVTKFGRVFSTPSGKRCLARLF